MAKSYIQSGPRVSASAGHVQPDIADVTDVRASVPEAVEVDGVVKAKVTITYKTPVILGEGDVKFTGVRVRIQRSSSIVEGESFVAAGEPASEESFDLLVSYSDTPEDQVIYLCSQSEKYTDLLVTKPKTGEKPGVTPNAAISLPANPLKGNAPDVLAFDAGTTDPPTGSFIRSGRWDRLNEKMLVDWGCLLPSELINWSGVAVFVKVPNGNFIQATGVIGRDDFTPAANGFPAHYDCIAIEGADLPAVPENWHYIAVSYDRSGRPNKDAEGNPTGPAIIVPTLQPKEKPDFNRPENPASVDFTSSIVGPEQVELRINYPTPPGENFIGMQFYLESPVGSIPVDLGSYDADLTSHVQIIKVRRQTPKQAENWKLWGVPYGRNYFAKLDSSCVNVTREISPYPASVAVTNVAAYVKTGWTDTGSERYGFKGTFAVPSDPVFHHCEISAQFDGDAREIWMADESDGDFDTSMWPMPGSPIGVTIRFYAVNHAGQRNTTNVPSVRLTVQPTIGTEGEERAPFVTDFTAALEYGWSEAGDQTYALYGSWKNPNHPSFKGVTIYCKDPGGRIFPLTDGNFGQTTFRTSAWQIPEGDSHSLTLYAVSMSGAGENTITAGTPQVVVTFSRQLGSAGQEYAELVTGFNAGVETDYDEVGGQQYRFYGSWTNPTLKHRYRGLKIVGRTDSGAFHEFYTAGADETSFRSNWRPMPESSQTWFLVPLSVDANNRVNPYVGNVTPIVAVSVVPAGSGHLKLTRAAAGQLGAGLTNNGSQIRIPDYGVSETLLAGLSVSQTKLANMQIIDAARLVDGAVGKMKLQYAKIIDAARIEDLAVGTTALQNAAVTNLKVANAAIDGLKLANAAVGTAHIQDLGVTWAKIANASIDYLKLGMAAVDNINIKDGTIQDGKIANLAVAKVTAGTMNVAGTGMYFSGSAGVSLTNGGNLYVNPGAIYGTSASFKSVGYGWDIQPGLGGYISGHGYMNANGGYRVNGVSGYSGSFYTGDNRTAYVSGGIITAVV